MVLTNKQEEGLKIAVARHRAGEKYTVISSDKFVEKYPWTNLTKL